MEEQERIRRNVAIATYMDTITKLNPETRLWEHCDGDDLADACLEYHCDWRWLMPVVEKILKESESGLHILPGGGGFTARFGVGQNIGWNKEYSCIEATWMAVSEWVLARETQKLEE